MKFCKFQKDHWSSIEISIKISKQRSNKIVYRLKHTSEKHKNVDVLFLHLNKRTFLTCILDIFCAPEIIRNFHGYLKHNVTIRFN